MLEVFLKCRYDRDILIEKQTEITLERTNTIFVRIVKVMQSLKPIKQGQINNSYLKWKRTTFNESMKPNSKIEIITTTKLKLKTNGNND